MGLDIENSLESATRTNIFSGRRGEFSYRIPQIRTSYPIPRKKMYVSSDSCINMRGIGYTITFRDTSTKSELQEKDVSLRRRWIYDFFSGELFFFDYRRERYIFFYNFGSIIKLWI